MGSEGELTMVLIVVAHSAVAELCHDNTELTPPAMVALGGMPVMTPYSLVMVV
jgi:hypothetical protein